MNDAASARIRTAVIAGVSALAAALAVVIGTRHSPDIERLEQKVSRLEKLKEQQPGAVKEVRTLVHERTVEAAAPQAAFDEPERPEHVPGASEARTPEEEQYRAEVIASAQVQALSDAFAREAADPEWSAGAALEVHATYENAGLASSVRGNECRGTMCRVDFHFADPESRLEQFQSFKHLSPWPCRSYFTFNLETGEGTAYLAREEFELPSVDVASLTF